MNKPKAGTPQCECGHSKLSHPFGLSGNIRCTGKCQLCGCPEFKEASSPAAPAKRMKRFPAARPEDWHRMIKEAQQPADSAEELARRDLEITNLLIETGNKIVLDTLSCDGEQFRNRLDENLKELSAALLRSRMGER